MPEFLPGRVWRPANEAAVGVKVELVVSVMMIEAGMALVIGRVRKRTGSVAGNLEDTSEVSAVQMKWGMCKSR